MSRHRGHEAEDLDDLPLEEKKKDQYFRTPVRRTLHSQDFAGVINNIEIGKVSRERLYRVQYEDGDMEHLSAQEVQPWVKAAKKKPRVAAAKANPPAPRLTIPGAKSIPAWSLPIELCQSTSRLTTKPLADEKPNKAAKRRELVESLRRPDPDVVDDAARGWAARPPPTPVRLGAVPGTPVPAPDLLGEHAVPLPKREKPGKRTKGAKAAAAEVTLPKEGVAAPTAHGSSGGRKRPASRPEPVNDAALPGSELRQPQPKRGRGRPPKNPAPVAGGKRKQPAPPPPPAEDEEEDQVEEPEDGEEEEEEEGEEDGEEEEAEEDEAGEEEESVEDAEEELAEPEEPPAKIRKKPAARG